MTVRFLAPALNRTGRAAHLRRMPVLLLLALLAALVCDWFRGEERLLFPKPLPVFQVSPVAP